MLKSNNRLVRRGGNLQVQCVCVGGGGSRETQQWEGGRESCVLYRPSLVLWPPGASLARAMFDCRHVDSHSIRDVNYNLHYHLTLPTHITTLHSITNSHLLPLPTYITTLHSITLHYQLPLPGPQGAKSPRLKAAWRPTGRQLGFVL